MIAYCRLTYSQACEGSRIKRYRGFLSRYRMYKASKMQNSKRHENTKGHDRFHVYRHTRCCYTPDPDLRLLGFLSFCLCYFLRSCFATALSLLLLRVWLLRQSGSCLRYYLRSSLCYSLRSCFCRSLGSSFCLGQELYKAPRPLVVMETVYKIGDSPTKTLSLGHIVIWVINSWHTLYAAVLLKVLTVIVKDTICAADLSTCT